MVTPSRTLRLPLKVCFHKPSALLILNFLTSESSSQSQRFAFMSGHCAVEMSQCKAVHRSGLFASQIDFFNPN